MGGEMTESSEPLELLVARDGGPVELALEIGAGLIGDWTLRLLCGGALDEAWAGTSSDRLPDVIQLLPERLLREGTRLEWIVTVYGPANDVGFDLGLRAHQGRRRCVEFPPRRQGELKARGVAIERGALIPKPLPPKAAR